MKWVVTVPEDVAGISSTYLLIKAAISFVIDTCDQVPLMLWKMQDQKLWTLPWCSFSRWGRERFAFSYNFKGCLYFVYDSVQPVAPQITQNTLLTIVDASLMSIFRIWHGTHRHSSSSPRRPIRQKQTVMYQWQCLTINSSISERDDKYSNPKCGTGDCNWWV